MGKVFSPRESQQMAITLRIVPLSLSLSSVTRKNLRGKEIAMLNWKVCFPLFDKKFLSHSRSRGE